MIDGKDIWPLMSGKSSKSPYRAFYYYYCSQLQAVRSGHWKLMLPLEARWVNFQRKTMKGELALYDVETDPAESRNVAALHPDVVQRLTRLAQKAREDLGDVDRPGKNRRPVGKFANPKPRVMVEGQ